MEGGDGDMMEEEEAAKDFEGRVQQKVTIPDVCALLALKCSF